MCLFPTRYGWNWRFSDICSILDSMELDPQKCLRSYLILPSGWLYNISMENGPFIDGLPIENGDFPWLC